ncbi:MAG: ROK family protein [bacterium]
MKNSQHPYIGIDIGGTKIRLTHTFDPTKVGQICDIPTPVSFAVARHHIEAVLDDWLQGSSPKAIGVASPGRISSNQTSIIKPTNIAWRRAEITPWLEARYKCPVRLVHDASAAGVCEARLGAGQKAKYILYISISTGIGSALILDGKPIPGPHNPEGGRMILQHPNVRFEQLVSGTAIKRDYGRIAARIHDKKIWTHIAQTMAQGIYDLIVASDPEVVILGGGVSVHYRRFHKLLLTAMQNYHPMYPLPPIKQATFTEYAPLLGALLLSSDEIE